MNEPVRGLVVAHSSLASGMVAAVRQISGFDGDALQPLSNDRRGPDALKAALYDAIGDAPAVLFTDMDCGSCALEARRLARERPDTAVVSGVNLSMLLDFVFHREMSLPELTERLVAKGKASIGTECPT